MTTPPQQAAVRRRPRALWIAAAAAAVVAGAGVTAASLASGGSEPEANPSSSCGPYVIDGRGDLVCTNADGVPIVVAPSSPAPTTAAPAPAPSDFRIAIKVTDRGCSYQVACQVAYDVTPQYLGAPLDPAVTWRVTYQVGGVLGTFTPDGTVEVGPHYKTFTITGNKLSYEKSDFAAVQSKDAQLTAEVTEVLPA